MTHNSTYFINYTYYLCIRTDSVNEYSVAEQRQTRNKLKYAHTNKPKTTENSKICCFFLLLFFLFITWFIVVNNYVPFGYVTKCVCTKVQTNWIFNRNIKMWKCYKMMFELWIYDLFIVCMYAMCIVNSACVSLSRFFVLSVCSNLLHCKKKQKKSCIESKKRSNEMKMNWKVLILIWIQLFSR